MTDTPEINNNILCEPLATYSSTCHQPTLFEDEKVQTSGNDISVIELFAGVGGFRIGLERASARFKTIWNNQWEPSTKRQDASMIYCRNFGVAGHSNVDISTVPVDIIPEADILVGGFPCQDYSVATTLNRSGGIEGKKGVLWWQIHRILKNHKNPPRYLILENVDRLLGSPASQRGRDFAIILASLSDLGYCVEWRVINAAEYGMPQRRRRTYMLAFKPEAALREAIASPENWIIKKGIMAKAFHISQENIRFAHFSIEGTLSEISESFNKGKKISPFRNSGLMVNREIHTTQVTPAYDGPFVTLGDILLSENNIPSDFFIGDDEVAKWQQAKGGKTEKRVNKATGFEYTYSEGAMAFPDSTEKPSRTIITGEGGAAASRFKHVVQTESGRYRRLVPVELERLNMFPDNHTTGSSDMRRAFLMGNALVTGIVERIGIQLLPYFPQ